MIAVALQVATAFNLVCTGTMIMNRADTGRPQEVILRVDLESGRFCFDDCGQVTAIERVSETEIVFQDVDLPATHGRVLRRLDRTNGAYLLSIESDRLSMGMVGRCVEAPFTGFSTGRR